MVARYFLVETTICMVPIYYDYAGNSYLVGDFILQVRLSKGSY